MLLKSSEEFVAGRHNLVFVGGDFTNHFAGMAFDAPNSPRRLKQTNLPEALTDELILIRLHPNECTLGDLFNMVHAPPWPWSVCYVRDRGNNLRPVSLNLRDGEVLIDSPEFGGSWPALFRVYGPPTIGNRLAGWLGR